MLINAAWGLGENVVQGAVDPDEYQVFKPLLSNAVADADHREEARRKGAEDDLCRATATVRRATCRPRRPNALPSCSSDADILALARWACVIEEHYGCPMDMEWAKDGETGELFIVQARPETVQSRREASAFKYLPDQIEGPEARVRASASAMRSWPAASA